MYRTLFTILLACTTLLAFATGNEGYLGVSVRSLDQGPHDGLRIVNVYDDGAAWFSGLMENDIITHVNGSVTNNTLAFNKALAPYKWGDMVTIGYLRNGVPAEMYVVLGFAANKKTYKILKSEQLTGVVIWYFDDNTTIITKNNVPQSITKKFENGEKETLDIHQYHKHTGGNLPQNFMDLQDKMDVIIYTLEEQELLNKDADQILFTKEIIAQANTAKVIGVESMNISAFEVFPNPSTGQFKVRIEAEGGGILGYDIYDMRGSSIESGSINDFENQLDLQFDLSSKFKGVYMLYFRLGDKKLSKQIVLN
ncbi:MAG: PDZ domain-containing protein [Bacteroidetes bacterium]|nr:PDZ domain-containing protein [Bacteroidota bacterium]